MTTDRVPEYDHNADLCPPHFLDRDPQDPRNCLVCGDVYGYGVLHLSEEPLPEPATDGPQLPEDGIDYWNVPCDVCDVQSGSCVSRSGHYRPAHSRRLEKAKAS